MYTHWNGRNGEIRTHDPLHPMQVRYQAALRPENYNNDELLFKKLDDAEQFVFDRFDIKPSKRVTLIKIF